jgi:hypothetical protein
VVAAGVRAVLVVVGALVIILLVSREWLADLVSLTASSSTGQFLGPFSEIQAAGVRLWRQGLRHATLLHPLIAVALVVAWRHRAVGIWPWLLGALISLVFLTNITVARAALFLWSAAFTVPLALAGLSELAGWVSARVASGRIVPLRVRRPLDALLFAIPVTAVIVWNVVDVYPTLEYRKIYHPQAEFYAGLAEELPEDALLLGMDNGPIATWYTGFPHLTHPVDPDLATAQRFVDEVRDSLLVRPVYKLPDFYAYDADRNIPCAVLARARDDRFAAPAYTAAHEDYHALAYGRPLSELVDELLRVSPGCEEIGQGERPHDLVPDLDLRLARLHFDCDGKLAARSWVLYRGRECFLRPTSVDALGPEWTRPRPDASTALDQSGR